MHNNMIFKMLLLWIFVANCLALPPVEFIKQFAIKHGRTSVAFHLPPIPHSDIVKHWSKMIQNNLISAIYHGVDGKSFDFETLQYDETGLHVLVPDNKKWKQSLKQFIEMYNNRTWTSREYWLVHLDSGATFEDFNQDFLSREIQADLDDDLFVSYHVNNQSLQIKELYKVRPSEDFQLINLPYGNYTSETGLILSPHEKWVRRRDLQGVAMKIVGLAYVPYITSMTPIEEQPGFFQMEGMSADIIFELQEIMNFTFTLIQPPDMQYGALQADGSWSGMVNLLQNHQVDFAITFAVTQARSEVISFALPILQVYQSLFIQNPSNTLNYMAFVEPLHYSAWMLVLIFCLVAPLFIFLILKFGTEEPSIEEFTLDKSFIFVFSALTMRGWSITPGKVSGRIAFAVLVFASILVYFHWNAMLISYLASSVIVLPFNNLRELVDQSTFVIALVPGSYWMDAFKFSEDVDWQRAWKQRLEPYLDNYEDTSEMINYPLQDSNVALYDDFFSASLYPEFKECKVIAIPAKLHFTHIAFGLQKDTPFLGIFNHYLHEMKEKGALDQIMQKYESGAQNCPDMSGQPLGFNSCFVAFLALIGGVMIGLTVMGLECVFARGKYKPYLDCYGGPQKIEKKSLVDDLKMQILLLESKLQNEIVNLEGGGD